MGDSPRKTIRGRGTASKTDPRYLDRQYEPFNDGWDGDEEEAPVRTTVTVEKPRTVISRNQSPDVPFDQSLNPYRGCEHGCVYCYARPTHAYLDLSPGLDFETKLFVKPEAPQLLRRELAKTSYRCAPLALGSNTDPYQPIEREWRVTRGIIEVLQETQHPLTIVTKSALVERDIDLLAPMAERNLVQVYVSVTSLDQGLTKRLEPRSAAPARRLQTLAELHSAGIPVGVLFAPVIPFLNDSEMESVLEKAAAAGVESAGYVMLRLPHEVKDLFRDWLEQHEPGKADHVMSVVNDLRGGKDNDPRFHSRMRGSGNYADLIRQRFEKACRRLDLNRKRRILDTSLFVQPRKPSPQPDLFD
ncbi:MAG: PA0069 family radical SAM protein [Gammaproteobacteria bacterium]